MIRCPKCGENFNPVDAVIQDDWREAILLAPLFGKQGKLVFEYVELFGVNPLKLKGGKVLRLLKQVKQVVDAEAFSFNKKKYIISKRGVFEGLQICCNRNFDRPLPNHNYLKSVLVGISEREEKERSLQGERDLRKREDRRRTTGDRTGEPANRGNGDGAVPYCEYVKNIKKQSHTEAQIKDE